jgi:predicted NACHT family NTPase
MRVNSKVDRQYLCIWFNESKKFRLSISLYSGTVTEIYLLRWGTLLDFITEMIFSNEFNLIFDMLNICEVAKFS